MKAAPPVPMPLRRPLEAYRGQALLLAVSGGADSVALLHAAVAVGVRATVAHFDHGLRPDSADDAAFVEALCARLGVPFVTERADVAAAAARRGWGLELAARTLRASFLNRAAKAAGLGVILTAHTRQDQAETVLWQVLRGEAVLHGMPAARGRLRRPWLDVDRAELRAYLEALGQGWREDESNRDTQFTRNWLRHTVLPVLRARYPGLDDALVRLARFQTQDDAALQAEAGRLTGHAPLQRVPLAVLRRHARQSLGRQPVHAGQLEHIARALAGGGTQHLSLPGDVPLTVSAGRLVWGNVPELPPPAFAWPEGWTLRHPQPGDQLRLPGGTRRLSDVLTDRKLPRPLRPGVWVLAQGQAVQWVGLPDTALWAVGAAEACGQDPQPDPEWHAMGAALGLARTAAHAGEVPVGAVVTRGGQIIGRGANCSRAAGDMTRHAELEALRQAAEVVGGHLHGCTLLVTLEPCPMCLGAAIEARVGRVVYGTANPKAGALGGVTDLLAHHWGHGPDIRTGLRGAEAAALLKTFFARVRQGEG